jgi:hypothetical protein
MILRAYEIKKQRLASLSTYPDTQELQNIIIPCAARLFSLNRAHMSPKILSFYRILGYLSIIKNDEKLQTKEFFQDDFTERKKWV